MARPRKIKSELAARLIKARGAIDVGVVAERCDVAVSTYAAYERGDTIPDAEFIGKFIKLTECDPWELLGVGTTSSGPHNPPMPAGAGAEFELLPRYSVTASAGAGLQAVEEGEVERLAFRREWLTEMGLDPRQAGLVTAKGDSMAPTIPDGALMLLDQRNGEPLRSGYIYVVVLHGDVLVKRVMRNVDGTVDLISDNPVYPVQKINQVDLDGLHIAGRVFWIGRRI